MVHITINGRDCGSAGNLILEAHGNTTSVPTLCYRRHYGSDHAASVWWRYRAQKRYWSPA